ncbi:MAG: hypothetical protein K9L68_02425 [Spirochaetales bacterium]|nr:hypothetical protein [Spirochaetales bacterium]MCF7937432.1 hypothetical protein [Spirochaetales bacterium]
MEQDDREANTQHYICPICGKEITKLLDAIAVTDDNVPAHFSCVVSELGKREELEPGERICYLGGGSFGVVQNRKEQSPLPFFIRKRIQYEEPELKTVWRRDLEQ